ncbi:MAG: tRNA preQ1(34) S-adenosylmethionine ribosyltransferase-isomerase QueA [Acidobacteriota bacterium]|nr:MAG: tRNA preQ1(34) S-adenosylmethionine ribosyltransferase-isomerase QueA [Acidobacteriota bacterium]
MRLSDLDFHLPEELIAQQPLADRSASRLLVVDRSTGTFRDSVFSEFPSLLKRDDLLVVNNSRVFPARLIGRSETGAAVEIFLVRELGGARWEALARPAKRLQPGKRVLFGDELSAVVVERTDEGGVIVDLECSGDVFEAIESVGRTPLPPYIKRERDSDDTDRERYQTVYAKDRGSIAAPTAGLHFTPEILAQIEQGGIKRIEVTLHVGYGTFQPIRSGDLTDHRVAPETYEISEAAARELNTALDFGRRIVAVGTTTTRTLEDCYSRFGRFEPGRREAELTITPGFQFTAVKALVTNFHLPQSSLLLLTSTFGGRELIMTAYEHAVAEGYRFYSYGDCMFIF